MEKQVGRQRGWPHVRTHALLPLSAHPFRVLMVAQAGRHTAVLCRQGAFTDSPFSDDRLDLARRHTVTTTASTYSQPRGFKLCVVSIIEIS